jgi:predicted RNase H-like HicB family nuclease
MKIFAAYIEYDPETALYVGFVLGISGARSQGAVLNELQHNLKEILKLCLEEGAAPGPRLPQNH